MLDLEERPYARVEVAPRPAIEAAIDKVLALESNDGCEHMVLLDSNGKQLVVLDGDEGQVTIPEERNLEMRTAGVLVHNHPNDSTLSVEDMMVVTVNGAKQIWAVTANGNKYWSKGFNRMVDSDLATYHRMAAKLTLYLLMTGVVGSLGEAKANTLIGHMINVMAYQRNLIDYHWSLSNRMYLDYVTLVHKLRGFGKFMASDLLNDLVHTQQNG